MITVPQSYTHKVQFNQNFELLNFQSKISKETYHHSDSNSSKNSFESVDVQHLKDSFDNSKCSYGNQGLNLCSNPHCQNNAVICFMKNCQCKENHKNCSNALFNGFLNRYEMKLKDEKAAIEKVQQVFEKLIDQVSQMEDQIIKLLRGSFLTSHQSQFILKLQNQDYSSLKGKQIAQVFSYLNQTNQTKNYTKFFDKLIEDIEQTSKQSTKSLQKLHGLLQKQINSKKVQKQQKQQPQKIIFQKEIENKFDSHIVTKQQQIQTLKQFFTNKSVKEMKLLYRASENNFSMEKFYQKCSNIPNTVIVMKTEFDKIIGGYTPLIWKKYEGAIKNRLEDPSLESFIFSVSENEKLQLKEKENATYYLSYAPGPRFGKDGCADLWICDQSNTKADSYVLGNMSYNNPKYSSCQESYKKIVGASTQYFTTKEWEVFEVKFQ